MKITVEEYIEKHSKWKESLVYLRSLLTDTNLQEEIKWGAPAYTLDSKNIVGLVAFKSYVGLWFHQGVFLEKKYDILEQSDEKTKGMRKLMFNSHEEVMLQKETLVQLIADSIKNHREGKEVRISKRISVEIPEILLQALEGDKELADAYSALSHGNQRLYKEYILEAKRDSTKQSRLKKIIPMIKEGKGLHDKYKS